jgi:hypothetical protein
LVSTVKSFYSFVVCLIRFYPVYEAALLANPAQEKGHRGDEIGGLSSRVPGEQNR